MDKALVKILLYISGSLFFISSLLVIPFVIHDSKSRNWPRVPAVIKKSEVKGEHMGSDDPLYVLDIEYEYVVNQVAYTGSEYGTHSRLSSKIEPQMKDMQKAYPVGRIITVAYDPEAPGHALMKPGIVWYHITGLAFVGLGAVSTLVFFFLGRKGRPAQ